MSESTLPKVSAPFIAIVTVNSTYKNTRRVLLNMSLKQLSINSFLPSKKGRARSFVQETSSRGDSASAPDQIVSDQVSVRSQSTLQVQVTRRARKLTLCQLESSDARKDSPPPGVANLLTCHTQNKMKYLEAVAADNVQNQATYLTQALATYRALLKIIGREQLMRETENWDPTKIKKPMIPKSKVKRLSPVNQSAQASTSQVPLESPSHPHQERNMRMRKRREHRNSIYREMMRMARSPQGGYQFLEGERAKRMKSSFVLRFRNNVREIL